MKEVQVEWANETSWWIKEQDILQLNMVNGVNLSKDRIERTFMSSFLRQSGEQYVTHLLGSNTP